MGQRFLKLDHSVPMTSPAIKVATIPMMAMVRGDWFPVSFSSVLFGIGVTVPVGAMVEVAVLPVVKVAGMPVTIFVWITVTTMGVCVGIGVSVVEGVLGFVQK
jgi:hypothetical protein